MGVRGCGPSLEEAFAQAAVALTAVVTEPSKVIPAQAVEVHCQAPDTELLLVDWLNAVVFEMATEGMLFSRFKVSIQDNELTGTAWGEAVDIRRHRPRVEVKGATYTQLAVVREDNGRCCVQCVVDV